jgi:dienelactone hydrolase
MTIRISVMIKQIVTIILLVIGTASIAASLESKEVRFKGTGVSSGKEQLILTGKLIRPQGNGPFPAIVLLHTSTGIGTYDDIWAKRLATWGYVSLQVDSFGPRAVANTVMDRDLVPGPVRAQDAYDAKSYLEGLPFIDRKRIAVIGWSHGGWATLHAVYSQNLSDPFKAAVAFYPICDVPPLEATSTPILILSGDRDANMPEDCVLRSAGFKKEHPEVILKIYPGEDHFFDWCDTKAAADAVMQVKDFLSRYLK